MADTFRRYAAGASVRDIEKATGRARATVSVDLASIETWTGKRFMRAGTATDDEKARLRKLAAKV